MQSGDDRAHERDQHELDRQPQPEQQLRDPLGAAGNGKNITIRLRDRPQVIAAIKHLKPRRIGHGIRAAYNEEAMKILAGEGVVLEICPSSNLQTKAVKDWSEIAFILKRFKERKIPFTINTDGPYLLETDMRTEVELTEKNSILTPAQVDQTLAWARLKDKYPTRLDVPEAELATRRAGWKRPAGAWSTRTNPPRSPRPAAVPVATSSIRWA